ncbi:O-antigen ligase family protein [Pontibacter vulgaris]|uniref:O-antigen ligase family protein n=1 Tax=Pontibacter vulgaris TaxID=2905679 RepID=UPI001FA7CAFB|nr:O-antigen ligase family protein [Pontibacter vulgaris]
MNSSSNPEITGHKFYSDSFSYLIYAYAVLLPLPNNLKSVGLISIGLFWLVITVIWRKDYSFTSIFDYTVYKMLVIYFLLLLLSVFVSSDKQKSFDYIVLNLSIILLPIAVYKKLNEYQIRLTTYFFIISLTILSLIAYYITYADYFHSFAVNYTNLKNLDWAYFCFVLPISVDFHAPYFSLYMCVGLLLLIKELTQATYKHNVTSYFILLLTSLYFIIFIALLSSRTAFIATIFVLTAITAYLLIKRKKYFITISLIVLITITALFLAKSVPYLSEKLSTMAGMEDRLIMWKAALTIFKDNLLFGVGTGDRSATLVDYYQQFNFVTGFENSYNSHNQYLDIAVAMGLPGIVSLISIFLSMIYFSFKKSNYFLLGFILVFAICCITESLLSRQAGVVLFSFISAIFNFSNKEAS